MPGLLTDLLHAEDVPRSQLERLGIPFEGEAGPEHLLVREQVSRAMAVAEPLPALDDLRLTSCLARRSTSCSVRRRRGRRWNVIFPV